MDTNAILSGLKTAIQAASPTPVAATPQNQGQKNAYTAPTIARLIEMRSFVDGMTLAGKLTSPDVVGALDQIRGLEILLAQEQQ